VLNGAGWVDWIKAFRIVHVHTIIITASCRLPQPVTIAGLQRSMFKSLQHSIFVEQNNIRTVRRAYLLVQAAINRMHHTGILFKHRTAPSADSVHVRTYGTALIIKNDRP
jgi:hypothetical protein